MEMSRMPREMLQSAGEFGLSRNEVERSWSELKTWHFMNDAGHWVIQDEGKPDRFATPDEAAAFMRELMDDPEMRSAIGVH